MIYFTHCCLAISYSFRYFRVFYKLTIWTLVLSLSLFLSKWSDILSSISNKDKFTPCWHIMCFLSVVMSIFIFFIRWSYILFSLDNTANLFLNNSLIFNILQILSSSFYWNYGIRFNWTWILIKSDCNNTHFWFIHSTKNLILWLDLWFF